ncbi:putative baseplate assembly protein [Serinicoccus sediminis]|uniref:putative baseplate assembly protein n=1 Tax=Serinicoccus sediminis TaxID=2306021 RepID=UPI0010213264|nr:putative baseplate assembly protein [Serinicoccus sediminis]
MTIPTPNLDDRRFQDLVDEAKRRIADRCPEWTDHNVSDPGVTLIELFAQMVDETLYRVNRLPNAMLVTMMNATGMHLQASRAARTVLTFWLSAPARYWESVAEDSPVLGGPGLEVATERRDEEVPVSFRTTAPARLHRAEVTMRYTSATSPRGPGSDARLRHEGSAFVPVFGTGVPHPGASLVLELARPLPGCAVKVDLQCEENRGTGVVPEDPPWTWEVWGAGAWLPCEVDRDTTGGLNRPGSVYLHVPPDARPADEGSGWLRCQLVPARQGQPAYEESPAVGRVTAQTLGVSVPADQADVLVRDEVVGVSDGTYGQPPFPVRRTPVVQDPAGGPLLMAGQDPIPWTPVPSLASSRETDRHYLLDRVGGQVRLGVAVRQSDGRVRRYGQVPPAGAPLRLVEYRVGGGSKGNVRAGAVQVLRSPVPHVRSVENRHAARGGVDAESVEQATSRLPVFLRQRTRAVTLADYVDLALDASVAVARAHALDESSPLNGPVVRVVLLPPLPPDAGLGAPLDPRELVPADETMTDVTRYLDGRRLVGTKVLVTTALPVHLGVTARVTTGPSADRRQVEADAQRRLYRLLHPLVGGEDGTGWPFGRTVRAADLYAVLQHVPGVTRVDAVILRDRRDIEVAQVEVPPHGIPLTTGHQIEVS